MYILTTRKGPWFGDKIYSILFYDHIRNQPMINGGTYVINIDWFSRSVNKAEKTNIDCVTVVLFFL